MKIRMGFVSNSSSSSFCIFGVALDDDQLCEYFDIAKTDNDDIDWEAVEDNLQLPYWSPDDSSEYWYIGEELASCPDDMTMGDYKKQTKEKIQARAVKPIPDSEFRIYEEVIYG